MTDVIISETQATLAPAPKPERDARNAQAKVEALLTGSGLGQKVDPPPAEKPTEAEKPLDWLAAAEKLGLKPQDLYGLAVPFDNGETRTFGQIKDGFRTADEVRVERETLQREKVALDADTRQSFNELDAMIREMPPGSVTRETVELTRQRHRDNVQREMALLLEKVPEWKEAMRWAADLPMLESYAKGFGYTVQELMNNTDHRLLLMLNAGATREKDLKANRVSGAAKVAQNPTANKTPNQAQQFDSIKHQRLSNRMTAAIAVEQLMRGLK